MSEEKKVDEKKVEKKSSAVAADTLVKTENQKKGSSILPLLALFLAFLVAVAAVMLFLNSQKIEQRVVDLQQQLMTMQTQEREVGLRVLALEDELVVMGLKQRLNKINSSRKNLVALQSVLSDNPEMVKKVQGLVDDLGVEQKRLKSEISGAAPKKFKASRPVMPFRQPPGYQCCPESGKCILMPNVEKVQPPVHVAPAPAQSGSAPVAPKAALEDKPQSGWSKFINTRIFGN